MEHLDIFTRQGIKHALVDSEDYLWVSSYKWSCSNGRSICARINNKTMNLARFILKNPTTDCIDHIDRDVFNNQKSNLRIATNSQNGINRPIINTTSGVQGVYYDKQRNNYNVNIRINKKKTCLGRFKTLEQARKAYNRAAKEIFGVFFNNA